MKTLGLVTLAWLLAVQAAAPQSLRELYRWLEGRMEGKQFTLRSPYAEKHLIFASDGTCQRNCEGGSWAGKATLIVRKVEISLTDLTITGDRLVVYYDSADTARAILSGERIRIDVRLSTAPTEQAITETMQRILAPIDPAQNAPPAALDGGTDAFEIRREGQEVLIRNRGTATWKPSTEVTTPLELGTLSDGEKVYLPSKALVAPRVIKYWDPIIPKTELQGHSGTVALRIVVDGKGWVQSVKVEKADYPRLIQSAVTAVTAWKFSPAMLDGDPVACVVRVEVNFHAEQSRFPVER